MQYSKKLPIWKITVGMKRVGIAQILLWWNENGKYFITRRIALSLPNRVYGVLRAEVKEKVFSDSISMFSEMPVDIQVKNGSAVLLEYNNEGEVNENSAGYEEERNLNDTGWKIIYRIDASYFSSAFHPRIIGSVVIVVLLLLLWIYRS